MRTGRPVRVEASHPLLVLRLSALGDVIHTIPAVVAIRRSRPGFAIGWVIERVHQSLVESVAPVDLVFPVELGRWRRRPLAWQSINGFFTSLRTIRHFARGGVAIDFQGLFKSAVIAKLSKASDRIGFERELVKEKTSTRFTNHRVSADPNSHVIEMNMRLAEAVGAQPIDPLTVDYSHFSRDRSGLLAVQMHDRPVILLPGAGWRNKRWPIAKFASLAERVRMQHGLSSVVVWGPGEEGLARRLARRTPVVRVAPPTDLRELAFLLSRASCVVAGDTGPLHLAAALQVPVVGLYGPTDPRRNGPWGQIDSCVDTWSGSRRMDEISVEGVMKKMNAVLADTSG